MKVEFQKIYLLPFIILFTLSCGEDTTVTNSNAGDDTDETIQIEKPPRQFESGNPGFFLDDWQPKNARVPNSTQKEKPEGPVQAFVIADVEDEITKIPNSLYGNNANTYMGQIVDEPKLLNQIQNLSPNVIRFPGGNLSNTYFWSAPLDNPPDDAPTRLIDAETGESYTASYWYGKNTQDWSISLDNYYRMLNRTDSKSMITVNYSYARYGTGKRPVETAAKLAADWVRYDNGRTEYWEIGNENHGPWQTGYLIDTDVNQDGQPERITGALYGEHFKIFADSMRAAASEIGAEIKIGAQLMHFDASDSGNPVERTWNKGFFDSAGEAADFYIVHNYYTPYNENSTVDTILESAAPVTHDMMSWMNTTFDKFGITRKPIALTEWNIFAVGSNQYVSDISGIHAVMAIGEMMKNGYGMASRWNLANGWDGGDDHGMFNQGDEPGGVPKWNPRPEFYHLYYLQKMFGDHLIFSWEQGSASSQIASYASSFESGHVALAVINTGSTDRVTKIELLNATPGNLYYWYTLEGGEDALFSRQVHINENKPEDVAGGPSNYQNIPAYSASTNDGIKIHAPGYSVTFVLVEPS